MCDDDVSSLPRRAEARASSEIKDRILFVSPVKYLQRQPIERKLKFESAEDIMKLGFTFSKEKYSESYQQDGKTVSSEREKLKVSLQAKLATAEFLKQLADNFFNWINHGLVVIKAFLED